jgi:two-component system sensor histidine kinase YesM
MISVEILKEKVRDSYMSLLSYIGSSIKNKLKQIEQISDQLFSSEDIKRYLLTDDKNDRILYRNFSNANKKINDYLLVNELSPYVSSIKVLSNYGTEIFFGQHARRVNNEMLKQAWWYDGVLNGRGEIVWIGLHKGYEKSPTHYGYVISMARTLKDINYSKNIGIIYIGMRQQMFADMFKEMEIDKNSEVLVIDNHDRIVYHPD